MVGNTCFCLKNRKLFPNLFANYFRKIFVSSKRPDISKKFPNFDNRTIPKLAKTKSSENSVFGRALLPSSQIDKTMMLLSLSVNENTPALDQNDKLLFRLLS